MKQGARIIDFKPAYNKVREGYGRGGVTMRFVFKGEKGAVQFLLFTGWANAEDRLDDKVGGGGWGHDGRRRPAPPSAMAADLGYHSREPRYEGELPRNDCPYLDGAPCYCDGSGLNAEDAFDVLTDDGEEDLWAFLESYYACVFDGAVAPPELGRSWSRKG